MRISTVCSGPLKFFTLQAPEMLQYVSQLYVQVPLSSIRYNLLKCCNMYLNGPLKFFTLQPPEMLQYVSQLYVQVPLSSLRYKLLKSCNMILNCMFRSS